MFDKKTKITFVLDSFGGGGKERRCLQLIQGLKIHGYHNIQVIIVNNNIAYVELLKLDVKLEIIDRKTKKLNIFQTYKVLYKLILEYKPSIVQSWGWLSTFFLNFVYILKPFNYVCSYVADCNKPFFFSFKNISIKLSLILSDYIVGNSKAGLRAYNIPTKKAKLIYNGFNEERFLINKININEFKKKHNLKGKYIVTMAARLNKHKDQETFLKAAKDLIGKRNDIDYLIIGEGEKLENLKNTLANSNKGFIHFLGFRPDIDNILKISDVSVLCTNSTEHKEGVSNTILESLAFGIPVIATNDGGTPEIIKNGVNGYLIDSFDYKDLEFKINKLLNDKELRLSFSKKAIDTVKEKFLLSEMTKNYIDLYKNVLSKKSKK